MIKYSNFNVLHIFIQVISYKLLKLHNFSIIYNQFPLTSLNPMISH